MKVRFLFAVGWFALECPGAAIVFSGTGANAAAIQGTVDNFRAALGTLNPNVAGSFGSGRREINWDGVPDQFADPNLLPANFFNSNSPRGAVLSSPGTGFKVSANPGGATPPLFGFPGDFLTFSPDRLFASLGSPAYDVSFFVPGSAAPAYTSGFGAIFTDVEVALTSSIEFFDTSNNSLGAYFVPVSGNHGLSFLGVFFNAGEQIGRVRVTAGTYAIDGLPGVDLVVADDFIYGEPNAIAAGVPEPASLSLVGIGALGIWLARRRNV